MGPLRLRTVLLVLLALLLAACGGPEGPGPAAADPEACPDCALRGARIDGGYVPFPFVGDLWPTTWTADDRLLAAFGDGTGMNACLPTLLPGEPDEFDEAMVEVAPGLYRPRDPNNEYCQVFSCADPLPQCPYTPVGLLALEGPVPDFAPCPPGPDQCVVSRHIPYGDLRVFEGMDKPSSLIAVGDRVYMHLHAPPGEPRMGYLAFSEDGGRTWTGRFETPWGPESPFRVVHWIQMGQAYRLNRDGYLYGLGIGQELGDPPRRQAVYLLRVPLPSPGAPPEADPILDYGAYTYFAGLEGGRPRWSPDPSEAVPVEGLTTMAQGAALYHPGIDRYLFLSGLLDREGRGGLFEARTPWGPWHRVATFPAGFIPGLIAKDLGPDHVYFTAAGGGGVSYNLNVGRLRLVRP